MESSTDGWWFTTAAPRARRVFVYYSDGDLGPDARSRGGAFIGVLEATQHARRALRPLVNRLSSPLRVAANSTVSSQVSGDGWVLAGDAAFTVDPLSSHGIGLALRWGAFAAQSLLDGRDAQAWYERSLRTFYHAYLTRQASIYRAERRWCERPFWARRHLAAREN